MAGLLIQFILSFLAAVIVGAILYAWRASRRFAPAGSVLAAAIVLAVTFWIATRPAPSIEVKIVDPPDGAEVYLSTLVKGTVSTAHSEVYVLVHPLQTDSWWVQNKPFIQNDGHWQTIVYTGTASSGVAEPYEVVAIATDENRMTRILRGSDTAPGQQLKAIPPYFAKSNLIVLKRKE